MVVRGGCHQVYYGAVEDEKEKEEQDVGVVALWINSNCRFEKRDMMADALVYSCARFFVV